MKSMLYNYLQLLLTRKEMKSIKLLIAALAFISFVQANASVPEEYVDECRQYAKEAEISNNDLDDYLKDCVESIMSSEGQPETSEQDSNNESEDKS